MPNSFQTNDRPRQTAPSCQSADRWSFRRRQRLPERAAGITGMVLPGAWIRRNGRTILQTKAEFSYDDETDRTPAPPTRSMLTELRRRVTKQIAAYRISGSFTEAEMRVIEDLLGGMSLRESARRQGVTAQAIECRIQRLRHRAPFFWRYWRRKNQMRARRT